MTIMVETTKVSCGMRQIFGLMCWNYRFEHLNTPNNYTSSGVTKSHNIDEAEADRRRLFDCIPVGYTILFSDNATYGNGERFANFIKEYDLGILTEHPEVINPNMNSRIRSWLWTWNGKRPTNYMKLPSELNKVAA